MKTGATLPGGGASSITTRGHKRSSAWARAKSSATRRTIITGISEWIRPGPLQGRVGVAGDQALGGNVHVLQFRRFLGIIGQTLNQFRSAHVRELSQLGIAELTLELQNIGQHVTKCCHT